MSKFIKDMKTQIETIHWPKKKELYKDTATVVIVSTVLSILISAFDAGINIVINRIISFF